MCSRQILMIEGNSMSRAIGVGVIGMGWMGEVHSRSYSQVSQRFPDCPLQPRLVVCADDAEARSRAAQARFGFQKQTTDWKALVDDPAVEVVNIAAPNHLHLEIVRHAANRGKHIFCEKPVGRDPQETAAIEDIARRAGVMTFVGYNYRWAPLVQYARKLIQEGCLGELTHYRGRFFAGYASDPRVVLSWRFQRDLAGLGVLGDLMSHVIDMAHLIAGSIGRVIGTRRTFVAERPLPIAGEGTHFTLGATGQAGKVTNEDYVGMLVEFVNGAQGTFEACRFINGPKCQMAFEVHGNRGALRWDFEQMNELHLHLFEGDNARTGYVRVLSGPEHPYHAHFNPAVGTGLGYDDLKIIEAYEFLKSIADGQMSEPSFSEALAVANVQAAVARSWETRAWERIQSVPSEFQTHSNR
jgi:predicted dehydrogenase